MIDIVCGRPLVLSAPTVPLTKRAPHPLPQNIVYTVNSMFVKLLVDEAFYWLMSQTSMTSISTYCSGSTTLGALGAATCWLNLTRSHVLHVSFDGAGVEEGGPVRVWVLCGCGCAL